MVPLPQTVREKVVFNKHPGLALDKYANSCLTDNQDKLQEMVQKPTIKKVVELSQVQPQGLAFENLCQRRETILSALGADRFFWLIRNLRTPGQLTVILRYFLVHPTKAYLVV
jgi:hypothetical protein